MRVDSLAMLTQRFWGVASRAILQRQADGGDAHEEGAGSRDALLSAMVIKASGKSFALNMGKV